MHSHPQSAHCILDTYVDWLKQVTHPSSPSCRPPCTPGAVCLALALHLFSEHVPSASIIGERARGPSRLEPGNGAHKSPQGVVIVGGQATIALLLFPDGSAVVSFTSVTTDVRKQSGIYVGQAPEATL